MKILTFFLLLSTCLEGAFHQAPSYDALRHQVSNQEVEIRTFENKLESLQTMLESVQDQLDKIQNVSKEQVKGVSNNFEIKIASLESHDKILGADLQQLKNHANETTVTLQAYKKTLLDYETRIKNQSQTIDNLTAALQTVLEAFQIKAEVAVNAENPKSYKIKNGDSLEKIARANGTTVQAIKELNQLNTDKIVVGKTLKLPE